MLPMAEPVFVTVTEDLYVTGNGHGHVVIPYYKHHLAGD